jgi:hypothetical protein
MKTILDLSHTEVKQYFLKQESYCGIDLPKYFVFTTLLQELDNTINKRLFDLFTNKKPYDFEDVNYKFLNNKDGKYSYRPLQLIHPAIYVSLVKEITQEANWNTIKARFQEFSKNEKIKCFSIPLQSKDEKKSDKAYQVSEWWHNIEQQSIELALKYDYALFTDITDCYGSIYTHSIPWAIHTKETSKSNKKANSLIGNIIDDHIRYMSYGQTNGIPQGSVLMDFIAEIVLGYADLKLTEKINNSISDYHIIRYRDDYRIFANNPQDIELITKYLTEVLIELGMKLNSSKTFLSNNIIKDSIKPDKLYWISSKNSTKNLQTHLLLIHILSEKFPNSGSLTKALTKFFSRIKTITKTNQNISVLISILVDIMYKNPKTYPIIVAILSKLLSLFNDKSKIMKMIPVILSKFEKIPNTGHLLVWLQRLTIKIDRNKSYDETLCKKMNDGTIQIWNTDWSSSLKTIIEKTQIIDENAINNLPEVIASEEVELFHSDYEEVSFDDLDNKENHKKNYD